MNKKFKSQAEAISRVISLLFIVFATSDCKQGRLIETSECGRPCYGGPHSEVGIGACKQGQWACDEAGKVTGCSGSIRPSVEICNGIDDDCNGSMDQQPWTSPTALSRACSTACGKGTERCIAAAWICDVPGVSPEVCNGKDDDCDGIVDNPEMFPLVFCYDGAPGTLSYPGSPCGPGVFRCESGKMVCGGQRLPEPEICDSIDNDCNGAIDNGSLPPSDIDIVFVVDNSGSMTDKILKIQGVVNTFVQKYATRTDLRWAIVGAPDNTGTSYAPSVQTDFTTPAQFAAIMLMQSNTGSGYEATIDAIDQLIDPANVLGLSWKAGANRSIVVFADEEPQSYLGTIDYTTIKSKILNYPGRPLADVVVFTDLTSYINTAKWTQAVGLSQIYSILNQEYQISQDLENIILKNGCR